MEAYLSIAMTALVLTQIIRVTQNWFDLRNYKKTDKYNQELMNNWKEIIEKLDEKI